MTGIEKRVDEHHKILMGNGQPGIIIRLAKIETLLETQSKSDILLHGDMKKMIRIIILLALLAGGSPIAKDIIMGFVAKTAPTTQMQGTSDFGLRTNDER